jgi:hypothetical protein
MLGCLIFLLVCAGLPWLVNQIGRFGYYQQWWLHDSLVARAFWLCGAPADFEQTLYGQEVEILMPGCENISSDRTTFSPIYLTNDENYLYLYDFFLDLNTGQRIQRVEGVKNTGPCGQGDVISPNGLLVAEEDGIYEIATDQKIITYNLPTVRAPSIAFPYLPLHNYYPCVWMRDGSTVILTPSSVYTLDDPIMDNVAPGTNFNKDGSAIIWFFGIPQPAIKYNLSLPDRLTN